MASLKWELNQSEFTGNWFSTGFAVKKIKPVCIYFKQSLRASHRAGWNRGAVRTTPPDAWGEEGAATRSFRTRGKIMSIMDDCSNTHGKILVIEDDADIRDMVKLQLEEAGYRVITAEDGEEGIALIKKGSNLLQVWLIITDIRMPKVNGVEAIEYIKANAPSIPIMVVTGYPETGMAIHLLQKGVKDYLVKPVEKETLLNKVSAILKSDQDFKYV